MHVIAKSTLLAFADKHPDARDKLLAWHKTMKACTAKNFNELKWTFTSADYVPKKYTVFDIGGNKYRMIGKYAFGEKQVHLFICWIGTHAEYDKLCDAGEQFFVSDY